MRRDLPSHFEEMSRGVLADLVRVAYVGCFVATSGCARSAAGPAVPTLEISVRTVHGVPLTTITQDDAHDEHAIGEAVDVEWRGEWWPATLVERRGEAWRVRYDGYGAESDEVVGLERIRPRKHEDGDDSPVDLPLEDDEPEP